MKFHFFKQSSLHRPLLALCSLAALASLPAANASPILTEAFDSPVGSIPADWVLKKRVSAGENTTAVEPGPGGGNALRFNSPTSVQGAVVSWKGKVRDAGITKGQIADFEASVDIRFPGTATTTSSAGVSIRSGTLSYDMDGTGYIIAVLPNNPESSTAPPAPIIGIWEGNGLSHLTAASALAQAPLTPNPMLRLGTNSETYYQLRVRAEGANVTGSLWTTGATPVKLGEVSIHNASHTQEGYFGLRTMVNNSLMESFFKKVTLSSIP